MIKCPDCGALISERAVACPKCGAPMTPTVPPQTPPVSTPQPVAPSTIENVNVSATKNRGPEPNWKHDEETGNHLPTALSIALCTYASVLLLAGGWSLMAFQHGVRGFELVNWFCVFIASIAILMGVFLYSYIKDMIWATVIGFFILTIFNIIGVVRILMAL